MNNNIDEVLECKHLKGLKKTTEEVNKITDLKVTRKEWDDMWYNVDTRRPPWFDMIKHNEAVMKALEELVEEINKDSCNPK